MRKVLLLDLDNCCFDATWREPLIASHGWDAFHDQIPNDAPLAMVVSLVQSLYIDGWLIIALTGRPERYRQISLAGMIKHDVLCHSLLMRPNDDYRKSPEMKLDLVNRYILGSSGVGGGVGPDNCLLIDDRDDICAVFSAAGIQSIQVFKKENLSNDDRAVTRAVGGATEQDETSAT